MKYTKPQDHNYRLQGAYSDALEQFARSLPAEFEIVPEDCVAVKVPIALTRAALLDAADWLDGTVTVRFCTDYAAAEFLRSIAAIAPVEKKKQTAELWLHVSGQKLWKYPNDNWRLNSTGWRKVGECEVNE